MIMQLFADMRATSFKHVLAVLDFRARRADFYENLCDVMEATAGKKTLLDILRDDSIRHSGSLRGHLSDYLANRYITDARGKMDETFRGVVPDEDVMLIGIGEAAGRGAFEQILRDLADYTRLNERAKSAFRSTVMAGVVAVCLLILSLFGMAYFTYPRLSSVFEVLPPEMWRGAAGSLRSAAVFLQSNLLLLLGLLGVVGYLLHWTLHNMTGAWRERVEDHFIWRAFRDFQAIRFMMTLAIILKPRQGRTERLRDGILMLGDPKSPWMNWHIEKMLSRIEDEHVTGAETFDTGILPRPLYHYLSDVCLAHGVDVGLQRTRRQVEVRVLSEVAKRALFTRWAMLLTSIGGVIGILFWHYAAIDALRRSLASFYLS
jgi:hypothetical protein